jgi:RNA polymerase sigma factor (sigma-70 family)
MLGIRHAPRNDYRPLPSLPEDVRELGRRARAGDEHARARLVEGLMPLALNRARRFAGPLVPLEEAPGEATAAVIKAVDRFDPDRGPLVPYAERWINGALRRTLIRNTQRRDAERGTRLAGWNETPFHHHESPEVLYGREISLGACARVSEASSSISWTAAHSRSGRERSIRLSRPHGRVNSSGRPGRG